MVEAFVYTPSFEPTPSQEQIPAVFYTADIPTLDEFSAPLESTKKEKKMESIFEYYNVDYEAAFLRNNDSLPVEQKQYYLHENVNTFLCEFAGKIKFKKLTYILRDDGLYYGDICVLDIYKKNLPYGKRNKAGGCGRTGL